MATFIIIGVLLLLGIWLAASYNSLIKLRNKHEEAYATMDVFLKKRYDLIPNLVETVKGYTSHEKDTLENVIKARNSASTAIGMGEKQAGEGMLNAALKNLFALAEAYPTLKADTQFTNLQSELSDLEDGIAKSRTYFNAVVKIFNTKCQVFPSNIAAMLFGFSVETYFEVGSESEREAVKVKF